MLVSSEHKGDSCREGGKMGDSKFATCLYGYRRGEHRLHRRLGTARVWQYSHQEENEQKVI